MKILLNFIFLPLLLFNNALVGFFYSVFVTLNRLIKTVNVTSTCRTKPLNPTSVFLSYPSPLARDLKPQTEYIYTYTHSPVLQSYYLSPDTVDILCSVQALYRTDVQLPTLYRCTNTFKRWIITAKLRQVRKPRCYLIVRLLGTAILTRQTSDGFAGNGNRFFVQFWNNTYVCL